MAGIDVRGTVLYAPGPWGLARPAAGVTITLVDVDVGNSNDTIWTGTTGSMGRFSGTTGEWRDQVTATAKTPLGSVSVTSDDPTDVLALQATLTQRYGGRQYSVTVPYVPAPPGLPQPPLVLTWGPPGIGKVMVDGVPVPSLTQFAAFLEAAFESGIAIAGAGVQHEVRVFGEELGAIREVVAALEPALRDIESALLALKRREQQAAGGLRTTKFQPGLQQAVGAAAGAYAATRASLAAGAASRPNLAPGPAGTDPWEAIRQQVLNFVRSIDPASQAKARQCDNAKAKMTIWVISFVVVAIVVSVVASMVAGLAGAALLVAAVAACVAAVISIVANLPVLLAALGLTGAAADLTQALYANTWIGSILLVVTVVCCVLIILATAPAAGWTWVVEQITGSDGVAGLRFGFAR